VSYISREQMNDLPDDPDEAFVELEEIARSHYRDECATLGEDESYIPMKHRYMSTVLPAVHFYKIDALAFWDRPNEKTRYQHDHYDKFMDDVDYCVSDLKLRIVTRSRQHSVALDADAKSKLRQMLNHIRETVDKLDISVAKKEALFKRINALQDEIDRDRTRYQAFAALMIEVCDDAGKAAKRLEPVVRLVERVGNALGIAKRAEDAQPKLPPHNEPKKLEPPKLKKNGFDKALDDEIPF
jgi:hypothetical protein